MKTSPPGRNASQSKRNSQRSGQHFTGSQPPVPSRFDDPSNCYRLQSHLFRLFALFRPEDASVVVRSDRQAMGASRSGSRKSSAADAGEKGVWSEGRGPQKNMLAI